MTKVRKPIAIFMAVVILFGLFVVVCATGNSGADGANTPSIANPFDYAQAPEGLDAFIYHGYTPYSCLDADTSECILNRLYVYNAEEDALIAVSEQNITVYAADMKGYPAVV